MGLILLVVGIGLLFLGSPGIYAGAVLIPLGLISLARRRTLSIPADDACAICDGTGKLHGPSATRHGLASGGLCPMCRGAGSLPTDLGDVVS